MKLLETINKLYPNKNEQYEYRLLYGLLNLDSKMKKYYQKEECQRVKTLIDKLGEDFETNKNKLFVAGYLIAFWDRLHDLGCYEITGGYWGGNGEYEESREPKKLSPLQKRELAEFEKKKYTFIEKVLNLNDSELINELLKFLQEHFPENWERRCDHLIETECRKILANFFVDEDQEVTQDNIELLKEFIRKPRNKNNDELTIDIFALARRIACRTKASREYN